MAGRHNNGFQHFWATVEKPEEKMDSKSIDAEGNFVSNTTNLRKILYTTAETSEEKFKVLDARDKLYKIMRDKDPSLKRNALIGTCPDMCPEKERLLREFQGRVSIFEMNNFSKNSNFNHELAVKEYARSSADQEEPLPHDLRPIKILTMTMSHLLHNVVDYCELTDDNLEDWYMFMWDRTRALRKELTQQGICNLESVLLVEQCARFHIHSAERLIEQDSSIFDDKINTENLTKCLQTLKYMYKDLAKEDVKCPNEPEFICYSLLLNLNNSSVFTELSDMTNTLMSSEPVKFALDVMTAWETRNYIRFFNLVKKTTYLNCCLLRRYFGEMRLYSIKTMIRSYCTKTYSPQIVLSRFVENLNFEGEEECYNFLSLCNFNFHKIDGRSVVNFDRNLFQNPKTTLTSGRAYLFIEEKKREPFSVVMAGGSLPPKLFESYVPQNSFTEKGDLHRDALPKSDLFDFFSGPVQTYTLRSSNSKEDSNKPTGDLYLKEHSTGDSLFQKTEKTEVIKGFSCSPLFSVKETNPFSSSIFGSTKVSVFSGTSSNDYQSKTTKNIFDSSPVNPFVKNIFGSKNFPISFGNENPNNVDSHVAVPFSFTSSVHQKSEKTSQNISYDSKIDYQNIDMPFQSELNKEEVEINENQESVEILDEKKFEEVQTEEEIKIKIEEEKVLLERKKQEEEGWKKELERKYKQKQEEEDRLKREEQIRLAKEKTRQEEEARQKKMKEASARHYEELKRQEEKKRKTELEHMQMIDSKLANLKKKIQKWKTKIIFEKWRMKTWKNIEESKMENYFRKIKLKYPPVCSEEMLKGNPYGLLIPSILTFEKFQNWKKELIQTRTKKMVIVNGDIPLLKIDSFLGKTLEENAKRWRNKLDPFPWKLIISVPDEAESPELSKSIETFVEMHFVQNSQWQFGVEKGPLYYRSSSRGLFRFVISIRRLRGYKMFEGVESNPSAMLGTNALIFFTAENENEITRKRLKEVLSSKPPLPKIPVIVISLDSHMEIKNFKKNLGLEYLEKSHVSHSELVQVIDSKHSVVTQLINCCNLAAVYSAPPSPLRISYFSDFLLDSDFFNFIWRRIEISLSNYKVNLREPKVLIEHYNSCISKLSEFFLDHEYDEQTILAPEFSNSNLSVPSRTQSYEKKLNSVLGCLALPHWPLETPKSCHQLNYRIHQYCKKIVAQDRIKLKNLKWKLYRIIRRSLLWKGLDIYCDEDINQILINFPWIQVFQEITGTLCRQSNEELKSRNNIVVIYDLEKLQNFSFTSSLIGEFTQKRKRSFSMKHPYFPEEMEESIPSLEKDSVVYAYSAAIERETNKRKREECIDESLDGLFSNSAGKRFICAEEEEEEEKEEVKNFNLSEIKSNFKTLSERLDTMKKLMTDNMKILTDIQNKVA